MNRTIILFFYAWIIVGPVEIHKCAEWIDDFLWKCGHVFSSFFVTNQRNKYNQLSGPGNDYHVPDFRPERSICYPKC